MNNDLLRKYNQIKNLKLMAAVIIDLVGLTTYVIPGAAEGSDMAWGPISGFLIYKLFPNRKRMALTGAIEEMLPFTDFIPTAYLAWRLDYVKDKNKTLAEFLNQRMDDKKAHHMLFNNLASFYGLYFESQKRSFNAAIDIAKPVVDLSNYSTVLDVGSGTGALCSVLADRGLTVTGVEPAEKMLAVAVTKTQSQGISFISGNVLEGLPFDDKSFDIVTASFVAHGLVPEHRKIMFAEMSRVAKHYVIFHDFNQNRSLQISFLEWLERGDYFRFIKTARQEMLSCETKAGKCFSEVRVIGVDKHVDWYICTPK